MNKIQDVDSFGDSPITYYTHLSDEVVVSRVASHTDVYINGMCVFRIREPYDGIRGIRSSIGIYDNTVTQDEIEQLIRPKCGRVFKTNY